MSAAPILSLVSVTPTTPGFALVKFHTVVDPNMKDPQFSILLKDTNENWEDYLPTTTSIIPDFGIGEIEVTLAVPETYMFQIYGSSKSDTKMTPLTVDVTIFDKPVLHKVPFNGNNVCRFTFSKVEGDYIMFKIKDPSGNISSVELKVVGTTTDEAGQELGACVSPNVYDLTLNNLNLLPPQYYKLRASFKTNLIYGLLSDRINVYPTPNYEGVDVAIELCDGSGIALPVAADDVVPDTTPVGFNLTWPTPANLTMITGSPTYFIYELQTSGDNAGKYIHRSTQQGLSYSPLKTMTTGVIGQFVKGEEYTFMVAASKEETITDNEIILLAENRIANSVATAMFYGLPDQLKIYSIAGESKVYWSSTPPSFASYTPDDNAVHMAGGQPYELNAVRKTYNETEEIIEDAIIGNLFNGALADFEFKYTMRKNVYRELIRDQNTVKSDPDPALTTPIVYYKYKPTLPSSAANTFTVTNISPIGLGLVENSGDVTFNFQPTPAPQNTFLWAVLVWGRAGEDQIELPAKLGVATTTYTKTNVVHGNYTFKMKAYFKDEKNLVTVVQTDLKEVLVVLLASQPTVSVSILTTDDASYQTAQFTITRGSIRNPVNQTDLYYGITYRVVGIDNDTPVINSDGIEVRGTVIVDSNGSTVYQNAEGAIFNITLPVFTEPQRLKYKVFNYYSAGTNYPVGQDTASGREGVAALSSLAETPTPTNTDVTNIVCTLLPESDPIAYISISWEPQTDKPAHTIIDNQVIQFTSNGITYSKVLTGAATSTNLKFSDFDVSTQGNLSDAANFLSHPISISRTLNFSYPTNTYVTQVLATGKVLAPVFPQSTFTASRNGTDSLKVNVAHQAYAGKDYSALNLLPNISHSINGQEIGVIWDYTNSIDYPARSQVQDISDFSPNYFTASTPNKLVTVTSMQVFSLIYNELFAYNTFTKAESDQYVELYTSITPTDTSGIAINYSVDQVVSMTFVSSPKNTLSEFFIAELNDASGINLFKQKLGTNGSVVVPWKGVKSGPHSVNYKITTTNASFEPLVYNTLTSGSITYPLNNVSGAIVVQVPASQTIDNGTPIVNFSADQIQSVTWDSPPVSFNGYVVSLFDENAVLQYSATDDAVVLKSCIGILSSGMKNWTYQVSHKLLSGNVYSINSEYYETLRLPVTFLVSDSQTIEGAVLDMQVTHVDTTNGSVRTRYDTVAVAVSGSYEVASGFSYRIVFTEDASPMFKIDSLDNVQRMVTATGDLSSLNAGQYMLAAGDHTWVAAMQRYDASGNAVGTPRVVPNLNFHITNSQRLQDATVTLTHSADHINSVAVVAPLAFNDLCDKLEVSFGSLQLLTISNSAAVVDNSAGILNAGNYDDAAGNKAKLTFKFIKAGVFVDPVSRSCNPLNVSALQTIEGAVITITPSINDDELETAQGSVRMLYDTVAVAVSGSYEVASGFSYRIVFTEDASPMFKVSSVDNVQHMVTATGDLSSLNAGQYMLAAGDHTWVAAMQRYDASGNAVGARRDVPNLNFHITNSQRLQDATVTLTHSADHINSVAVVAPLAFNDLCDKLEVSFESLQLLTISNSAAVVDNSAGILNAGNYDDAAGNKAKLTFKFIKAGVFVDPVSRSCNPLNVSDSQTIEGAVLDMQVTHVDTTNGSVRTRYDTVAVEVSGSYEVASGLSYRITFTDSSGLLIFFVDEDSQRMGSEMSSATEQQDNLGTGVHTWTASIQRYSGNTAVGGALPINVPTFTITNSQRIADATVTLTHLNDTLSALLTVPLFFAGCDSLKVNNGLVQLLNVTNLGVFNNTSDGILNAGVYTSLSFTIMKAGASVTTGVCDLLTVLASQTIESADGFAVTYSYNHIASISFTTLPNTTAGYLVLIQDASDNSMVVFDSANLGTPYKTSKYYDTSFVSVEKKQLTAGNYDWKYSIKRKLGVGTEFKRNVSFTAYDALTVEQADVGLIATLHVPSGDVTDLSGCVTFNITKAENTSNNNSVITTELADQIQNYTNTSQTAFTALDKTYKQPNKIVFKTDPNDSTKGLISLYLATNLLGLNYVDYTIGVSIENGPVGSVNMPATSEDIKVTNNYYFPLQQMTTDFRRTVDFWIGYDTTVNAVLSLTDSTGPREIEARRELNALLQEQVYWTLNLDPGTYNYRIDITPVFPTSANSTKDYFKRTRFGTFNIAKAPSIIKPSDVPNLVTAGRLLATTGSTLSVFVKSNNAKLENDSAEIFVVSIATPAFPINDELSEAVKSASCVKLSDDLYKVTFEYTFVVNTAILIASTDVGVAVAFLKSDGTLTDRGGAELNGAGRPILAEFTAGGT